ncbi:MAG: hypothetical protein ABJG78_15805 [Cyclobacteriaceae bacterium]
MRLRPKSDYLHQSDWEELYILTKHWKSDMEFYSDEIDFLRLLMDKYFIWLIEGQNISHTKELVQKLSSKDQERQEISELIEKHLHHLEGLLKSTSTEDDQKFRDEHAELEDRFTDFVKAFMSTKREAFSMTEHVMESEKIKRLLSAN